MAKDKEKEVNAKPVEETEMPMIVVDDPVMPAIYKINQFGVPEVQLIPNPVPDSPLEKAMQGGKKYAASKIGSTVGNAILPGIGGALGAAGGAMYGKDGLKPSEEKPTSWVTKLDQSGLIPMMYKGIALGAPTIAALYAAKYLKGKTPPLGKSYNLGGKQVPGNTKVTSMTPKKLGYFDWKVGPKHTSSPTSYNIGNTSGVSGNTKLSSLKASNITDADLRNFYNKTTSDAKTKWHAARKLGDVKLAEYWKDRATVNFKDFKERMKLNYLHNESLKREAANKAKWAKRFGTASKLGQGLINRIGLPAAILSPTMLADGTMAGYQGPLSFTDTSKNKPAPESFAGMSSQQIKELTE
tara:strand:- start:15555 stop:16619 length:1065 start_codon:yes stop_codon:yes gene_type:complete